MQDCIAQNKINQCSRYYDGLSQISFAFALALNNGVDCIKDQSQKMISLLVLDVEDHFDNLGITRMLESALALQYLSDYDSLGISQNTLDKLNDKINKLAQEILLNGQSFDTDAMYLGTFPLDVFDWHSESYVFALLAESLQVLQ